MIQDLSLKPRSSSGTGKVQCLAQPSPELGQDFTEHSRAILQQHKDKSYKFFYKMSVLWEHKINWLLSHGEGLHSYLKVGAQRKQKGKDNVIWN